MSSENNKQLAIKDLVRIVKGPWAVIQPMVIVWVITRMEFDDNRQIVCTLESRLISNGDVGELSVIALTTVNIASVTCKVSDLQLCNALGHLL